MFIDKSWHLIKVTLSFLFRLFPYGMVALAAWALTHGLLYERAYKIHGPTLEQAASKASEPLSTSSDQGTGFFSTTKAQGKHWLIDPEGNPFVTIGMNDVDLNGSNRENGTSPYRESLEERNVSKEEWIKITTERLLAWGFNSFGLWVEPEMLDDGIPYTRCIDVTTTIEGVRTEDFFAPEWVERVEARVQAVCLPLKDDPLMMGYFTDNENTWGPDWRTNMSLLQIYQGYVKTSPGRQKLHQWLRDTCGTLDVFNAAWGTTLKDWDAIDSISPDRFNVGSAAANKLTEQFAALVMEQYATTCMSVTRKHDPNHLVMGCRFAFYPGDEVMLAAARHFDVISLACYFRDPICIADFDRIQEQMDRPVMIEEFSFKSYSSGYPNLLFFGPETLTQAERALTYANYVETWMSKPYAVGYHWYKYTNNPWNLLVFGENWGMVNDDDEPYAKFVDIVGAVNRRAGSIHAGHQSPIMANHPFERKIIGFCSKVASLLAIVLLYCYRHFRWNKNYHHIHEQSGRFHSKSSTLNTERI